MVSGVTIHFLRDSHPLSMNKSNNSNSPEIPSLFQNLLEKRGIVGADNQYNFLFPQLKNLPSPAEMLNLTAGARLVTKYILAQKPIIIWGDYDVDGTTGTSLLVNFLKTFGIDALWHIPNRLAEGYGLNAQWFVSNGASIGRHFLVITVDSGVSDSEAVESIKNLGGEVIVTDHHTIPENFQPKSIVINPSQQECGFNGHHLAGVGVAFYLAAGVRAELTKTKEYSALAATVNLKQFLPFVALGTIADIVEITNVNRILVRAGLEALKDCTFPGINALVASCDIFDGEISSEDVGFLLGPKINAAGRLGQSEIVVQLLTEESPSNAKRLALKLVRLNERRREISDDSLETALTIARSKTPDRDGCLVVFADVHKGVAGIVASKLVDKFKVPVAVLVSPESCDETGVIVGSLRSVPGVNIVSILGKCEEFLEKFGGHKMAAGLSLRKEAMVAFENAFTLLCKEAIAKRELVPTKRYDVDCSVEKLMTEENIFFLKQLEPFGPRNPQPVFYDKSAVVIDSRTVGRNKEHLNTTIRTRFKTIKGIGFGLGNKIDEVQETPKRNLVYAPTINRFRGTVSWQVRIIDI